MSIIAEYMPDDDRALAALALLLDLDLDLEQLPADEHADAISLSDSIS